MTTLKEAGLATIDMKLEVIVIPVSDAERAEQLTSRRPAPAYSNSRRRVLLAPYNSARASPRPLPVRPRKLT